MKALLLALTVVVAISSAASAMPAFQCFTTDQKSGESMETIYAITDPEKGFGMIIGNSGTADVMIFKGTSALNFVELTFSGSLHTMTIGIDMTKDLPVTGVFEPIRYKAVYSRHTAHSGGAFTPALFQGTCTLKN